MPCRIYPENDVNKNVNSYIYRYIIIYIVIIEETCTNTDISVIFRAAISCRTFFYPRGQHFLPRIVKTPALRQGFFY